MYFKSWGIAGLLAVTFFAGFKSIDHQPEKHNDDGHLLFIQYCGTCHMLPDPASLTKPIWRQHVLPVMAARLGIIYPNYNPLAGLSAEEKIVVNKNHIIPDEAALTQQEWDKLAGYVINAAPDTVIADENRLKRDSDLKQFTRSDLPLDGQTPSMVTGLRFNNAAKTLCISTFYNQVFNWQFGKGIIKTIKTESPVVDFNFLNKDVYLTQIGKLYPTELSLGNYTKLSADGSQTKLIGPTHRPVNGRLNDLYGDGKPEVILCNFGNKTGGLGLYTQDKTGAYKEQVLLNQPGAIKCYVRDMDGDGKKDIVALFAQGDESVYILYQKDNKKFKARRVLRFPPNYGTTDMVLTDYNHDGLTDIITVHGDNADYSQQPKAYHGIRINLDMGKNNFKEKFFYPIYGATRVLAEDFDKDGDIDLAVSAFFPDFGKLVTESFVYLENKDQQKFTFKAYTLKSGIPIKTLTLEKGDIDGDGDIDIIAGNFAQSPGAVPADLDDQWKSAKYGLTIFSNNLIKK